MKLRFAAAVLALTVLAAPALAQRHADVVYMQQFKARQKLLADAAKTTPKPPVQQVAKAAEPASPRTADTAGSR